MSDPLLDASVAVPGHVVYREFPSETIVLNLHTGQYHGLNPTAQEMLRALERGPTVRDAAKDVAAAYSVPLERVVQDIVGLVDGLVERGLVEVRAVGDG